MSTRERHIFLDWDGVVRAEFRSATDDPFLSAHLARLSAVAVDFPGSRQMVIFDPEAVRRLNAISELPNVTIFWLSAVGKHARNTYGPAVGLHDFMHTPHASDEPGAEGQWGLPSPGFRSVYWYKAQAITDHLSASDADVMWLDDNIIGDLQQHFQMDAVSQPRISWVRPEPRLGLSPSDLDSIERWARTGEYVRRDATTLWSSIAEDAAPEAGLQIYSDATGFTPHTQSA